MKKTVSYLLLIISVTSFCMWCWPSSIFVKVSQMLFEKIKNIIVVTNYC